MAAAPAPGSYEDGLINYHAWDREAELARRKAAGGVIKPPVAPTPHVLNQPNGPGTPNPYATPTNPMNTRPPVPPVMQAATTAPFAPKSSGQSWLDWTEATYGTSQSRGAGFADLPGGTSVEQALQRYNKDTGANAKYLGGPSGDRVDFGDGRAYTDVLTAGGQLWSDRGDASVGVNRNTSPGGRTLPRPTMAPAATPHTTPGLQAIDPLQQQLIDQLLKRSQQSLDVNADNSPAIRAQSDPYRAQVERQRRDYLADIAEKSGPNANMRGEERVSSEHAGQAIGLNDSRLVGLEIDARRQEIQDALTSMQGYSTEQQRQVLTKELAALNDATNRLGITTGADTTRRGQDMNNDQFLRDLGLRAGDRDNYWDALNKGLID